MHGTQEQPHTEKKNNMFFKGLKNKLCSTFQKKKCEDKTEAVAPDKNHFTSNVNDPPRMVHVTELLAEANRLKREQAERQASIKAEIDHDELQHFSYKIVKDEQNASRSSKDSGFADDVGPDKEDKRESDSTKSRNDSVDSAQDQEEEDDELVDTLKGLDLNEDKKKKLQQVVVARGKGVHKTFMPPPSAPYQTFSNRQILSGGQVTVNPVENGHSDISLALSIVDRSVRSYEQTNQDEMRLMLDIAQDYINGELKNHAELGQDHESDIINYIDHLAGDIQTPYFEVPPFDHLINPVEEFHLNQVPQYGEFDTTLTETLLDIDTNSFQRHDNFLTPPRSNENAFNPDSPPFSSHNRPIYSAQSPMSDDIFSPPEQSDAEVGVCPDLPESVIENEQNNNSPRERHQSSTSLNLKQFKDLQNKLSSDFAKEDCCKREVPLAREWFKETFNKLDEQLRADLVSRLSALSLETCYGVLHHVLMGFSTSSDQEGLLCSVFSLICERILGERPALFLEDFGLNLLKAAALRCPDRPILTRYLVQSVHLALEHGPHKLDPKQPVFKETDQLGDNLVGVCARRGDACAGALAELVRARAGQPPLFDVAHSNAEGMSALHVACSVHGSTRALRVVHVLLKHAGADVWQGDVKGGDTALHYAVKPGACDLDLVMTLFKHVDRKKWKQLAHAPNRSLVSPIETARAVTKSSRYNYPEEVLSFLKKCRT